MIFVYDLGCVKSQLRLWLEFIRSKRKVNAKNENLILNAALNSINCINLNL